MKIAIINSTQKQYAAKDFGDGHDFTVVNTLELNIKYCTGCFGCWHKTPGLCVQKDNMPQVLRAQINADLVVFVADVLTGFVSAEMKKINDKSIPLLSPFMSIVKGEVHHAKRYEKYPDYGLVLIEKDKISDVVFDIIKDCYSRYAINFRSELRFALKDGKALGGLRNELNNY